MTSIGGDGARNDDGYDRKALTQVWQFSSYLDYGLGYNKSRGSCSSSQCDDDEDEKACSTSGMATDVGSMSMTFSRRAKQKSINLQYNTLVCWADGTNDSLTKCLMFKALFLS